MRKATRAQTKEHNRRLVLRTIFQQGKISRAGIARLTRLTRPTVSRIVIELLNEGLVGEVGRKPSGGGKPATLLSVSDDSRQLICLDLANSEFRGAIVNLRGTLQHSVRAPIHDQDGEAALALVQELIDQLIAAADARLLGIGIGTPGLIDAGQGIVRQSVNLEWRELPLRELLEARYQLPVYVSNDCQAAALGEYTFGNPQQHSSLVVVKVGRGIGAGIVIDGQLYHGDGSGAGEIGHIVTHRNGQRCRCGHFGCLETMASSRAIVRQAGLLARANHGSALYALVSSGHGLTTDAVVQAFQAGDSGLLPVIEEAGHHLGIAVAGLVNTLNIEHIVIAGSAARFGEPLLASMRKEMHRRSLAALAENTTISSSQLGSDIVILGAAALLLAYELGLAG